MLLERRLHWMQGAVAFESFDRRDVGAVGLDGHGAEHGLARIVVGQAEVPNAADARDRMVAVTADVDDPESARLLPGTFVEVEVPVGTSGTSGGFKKFVRGELDICDASRPISESEKA